LTKLSIELGAHFFETQCSYHQISSSSHCTAVFLFILSVLYDTEKHLLWNSL